MQFHSVLRALSLFGVVALLGLRAGESSDAVAHAGVRPEAPASVATAASAGASVEHTGRWRLELAASVPQAGPAAALQASVLPAEPASTAAEMQLALAGVVGRAAHLGRGVVMEDARCDEAAGGGDCGAVFLREVAALDPAAAAALAPAVARLGESVGTLRVTRWSVEGDGVTAHGAVTVQGLRDGRVAGLAVYR